MTSPFDLDALLAPVSDAQPCGPDLRSEPDFREIEDAPGSFANLKPPELMKIVAQCAAVLGRTKDQMPAIVAAQAAARAGDLEAATGALAYVSQVTETYWDEFHPGPADEMLIGRLNELSALARPAAMLLPLQRMALARLPAPSGVEFTAAMLERALTPVPEWGRADEERQKQQLESGAITGPSARTQRQTHDGARQLRLIMLAISPASAAADREAGSLPSDFDPAGSATLAGQILQQVSARREELRAFSDVLYTIFETYERRVSDTPNLGPVMAQIRTMLESAERFEQAFTPIAATVADEEGGEADEAAAAEGPTDGSAPRRRGFSGDTPRNRTDVLTSIDEIIRYYAEHEPTSPVPLMLKRVRQWVDMDFVALMKNIAPSSTGEVEKLLAIDGE